MAWNTDKMRSDLKAWAKDKSNAIAFVIGGAGGGVIPDPIGGSYPLGLLLGTLMGLVFYLLYINMSWAYDNFKEKYKVEQENE
jgi:F0F1-type ATP synthase assembly protein I